MKNKLLYLNYQESWEAEPTLEFRPNRKRNFGREDQDRENKLDNDTPSPLLKIMLNGKQRNRMAPECGSCKT